MPRWLCILVIVIAVAVGRELIVFITSTMQHRFDETSTIRIACNVAVVP